MKNVSNTLLDFLLAIALIILLITILPKKRGMVVLLNGTSSAGKSAILKELAKLNSDYYILRYDDWFPAQVVQKAKELGWKEESNIDPWLFFHDYLAQQTGNYYFATEVRQKLFPSDMAFYQLALDRMLKGQNVIIDTVLEYEKDYQQFFAAFNDFKTKKILIYCAFEVLLERVKQRNVSGIPEEMRTAFRSFEQFPGMYKVQEHPDEIIIDVVKTSVMKKALDAAIQELIKENIPKPYIPRLEEFKRNFIKQFKLDEKEEIALTPTHS